METSAIKKILQKKFDDESSDILIKAIEKSFDVYIINKLTESHQDLKDTVHELAEAQKNTEIAVRNLARQVGGLSENLGGSLEDLSYQVVPYVLEKELGLELGEFTRNYLSIEKEEIEFNIYSEGYYKEEPNGKIIILGEVKSNITQKEMKKFCKQIEKAKTCLPDADILPVFFGFRINRDVFPLAREKGIRLIFSYGKMI